MKFFFKILSLCGLFSKRILQFVVYIYQRIIILGKNKMKCHTGGGGGGTEQCHQMTKRGGESKISQKSVTYYLNGPLSPLLTCLSYESCKISTYFYHIAKINNSPRNLEFWFFRENYYLIPIVCFSVDFRRLEMRRSKMLKMQSSLTACNEQFHQHFTNRFSEDSKAAVSNGRVSPCRYRQK